MDAHEKGEKMNLWVVGGGGGGGGGNLDTAEISEV